MHSYAGIFCVYDAQFHAFLSHAPTGGGLRHPHGPGIAWTQGCEDHNDLHPCAESRPQGRPQPNGRGPEGLLY